MFRRCLFNLLKAILNFYHLFVSKWSVRFKVLILRKFSKTPKIMQFLLIQ